MVTMASFEHLTDALARVTPVLLDSTLKGSAVLAVAWLAASGMRRSSSAARHMVWFATLASLLVLPLLSRALPAWQILPESWDVRHALVVQRDVEVHRPVETPQASEDPAQAVEGPTELPQRVVDMPPVRPLAIPAAAAPRAVSTWAWIGLVWLAGAGLLVLRLLAGVVCLLWASWRLRPCTDSEWRSALLQACRDLGIGRRVRLLQGRENAMPMTWGLFVPHLLVPARASEWTPSRRRVVLLHELAHVKRWDCLTQTLAEVACAIQWFNPLAWLASKQMQNEAERACDDLVIARGSQPTEYAEHLLQIAASQHQGYLAAAMAAIPMARASKLEGRLLAILDNKRSRRAMTLGAFVLAVALVAGIVVPVAMLRGANKPTASQKDAAATVPATGQAVAQLPDGLTVEVAGISYHPSEGRQWWGPDGTVGEQYAFVTPRNSVSGGSNTQTREFVVWLKGEGAEDAGLRWHNDPPTGGASGPAKPAKGTAEGVLQCLAAPLPAADKTATIRVDVATGSWMTLAEETAGGLSARDGTDREGPTIFSPAYESNGGAGISVSHNILEGQVRIVAIDKDGQEHTTRDVSSGSAGGISQTTAHFAKLPLKDVKSFRLEARGYLWVTFRNVSLEPGYKTDVQVEVGPVPEALPTRTQPLASVGRTEAGQQDKRSLSANNMAQILRGIHIYLSQNNSQWPDDLRQIVENGLGKAYDESADYLTNPARPGTKPAYVYVRPEVPLSRIDNPGREVAIYEAFDDWGGGINVGFLDGHVTFMDNQEEFQKLLGRAHQKRMERYMNLGAPSSAPATPLPGPVGSPKSAPTASVETSHGEHVLEPGDTLRITIAELLAQGTESVLDRQVNESGQVYIPVLGAVKLGGMTPREAETHIADLVQPVINRRPRVSVVRKASVATTGRHAELDQKNMTLAAPTSAPAAALPSPIAAPATQPEGEFYVLGTPRPGVFSLTGRKISLLQGLAAAGGLKPGSKTVSLLRPDRQGRTNTIVTLSVEKMPWPDSPLLQPGDVIYVSGEPLAATQVLTEAKAKLAALKAQYETYQKIGLDKIPLTPEIIAAVEADPQVANLEKLRMESVEARQALVEQYGKQHRSVSDLDNRIQAVEKEAVNKRLEKTNEYKRMEIERVRLDMLAAEAEVKQLEGNGAGAEPNRTQSPKQPASSEPSVSVRRYITYRWDGSRLVEQPVEISSSTSPATQGEERKIRIGGPARIPSWPSSSPAER